MSHKTGTTFAFPNTFEIIKRIRNFKDRAVSSAFCLNEVKMANELTKRLGAASSR